MANEAAQWAIGQTDRTVMNYYKVAAHGGDGPNNLAYVDNTYPDDWPALYQCVDEFSSPPDPKIYCDHAHIFFNLTWMPPTFDDYWKHVACHEFGHSAGLEHNDDPTTCVERVHQVNTTEYGPHDVDMINFLHP